MMTEAKIINRVINTAKALRTIAEMVSNVCECGCTESEHYTSGGGSKILNCAECECPKFRTVFKLKALPKA